jgi:hypothetical protein
MPKLSLRHALVSVLLLVALLAQETWALAGTTGGISVTVRDAETGAPVAGAQISAASPSETVNGTTDAAGRFTIVSLAPDSYTVTVTKTGYQDVNQAGIQVFADNMQTLAISMHQALKTIAQVTSRAAGNLVKAGTTSDVYSVNAATANAVQALGGGGSLNSAYSAIASQPGVFVPQGQSGWAQSVYVRGANYTQLGYEFDGVPVQRSFDQYPATTLSALGQQELQVYTGAQPANAQSGAIGGYINQVIKTGTFPGFGNANLGIGTPTFYHHAMVEAGGASPSRLFSYYAGIAGYNQDFRYASQYNGANLDQVYGSPYNLVANNCGTAAAWIGCYSNFGGFFNAFPIGPSGTAFGPITAGSALTSALADREAVVNFHFGIPHKHDAGRDDVQLLYDVSFLRTQFPTAMNDWNYAVNDVINGTATINGVNYPNCAAVGEVDPTTGALAYTGTPCATLAGTQQSYFDTMVFNGPVGAALSSANLSSIHTYFQPGSPTNRQVFAATPPNERDFYSNNSAIAKLQYQKNIGSSAYFRIYGYTFYSDWLQQALSGATLFENFVGVVSPDYGVITHTNGVVGQFADQITPQHLLTLTGGYTRANTIRWNDAWYAASPTVAVAVDSTNPTDGICYKFSGGAMLPLNCDASGVARYRLPSALSGVTTLIPAHATDPTVGTIGGFTCGAGPCEYYTVNAGYRGAYNTVTPQFTNAAFEDTWRPSDRFVLNAGVHYDDFRYGLADTSTAPSFLGLGPMTGPRTLYQNSFRNWYCFNSLQGLYVTPNGTPNSCPAGQAVQWTNTSPASNDYHAWEPRVGLTYTVDPLNVIRASWGKYEQPASSAFQQYQNANNNLPLTPPTNSFYPLGFTSPAHQVFPEESFNSDLSWEHQVKGTDWSWKITPFYRHTKNEIFNVLLDPKTNFVSGVNVGRKDVYGVELAVQKGDFTRNGWAGLLSYTYTYGKVHFDNLANGTSVVTGINSAIAQYNAYTSKCAAFQATPTTTTGVPSYCLTPPLPGIAQTVALPTNGASAAPCYTSSGTADPACASGSIANPYWNAPPQALFNAGDGFIPYNQLPGTGVSSVASSYIIPHVATLVVNYRHNRFAITPLFQVTAGGKYGSPVQGQGIDPATCAGALTSGISGDPRYQYGASGGAPYDAQTCAGFIVTPNFFTKNFDNFGAFTEPTQITANMQISYDVSPTITLQLIGTNLWNTCFGGSNEPWNTSHSTGCWYTSGIYTGNFYNPGNPMQPAFAFPYTPTFSNVFQQTYGGQVNPFQLFLSAQIKI